MDVTSTLRDVHDRRSELHPNIIHESISILNDIKPENLKSTTHEKYVERIAEVVGKCLVQDVAHLFLLLDSIKSCQKPCYKRDTLLDVLNRLVTTSSGGLLDRVFSGILSDLGNDPETTRKPWKELANSLASLPDLVANCNALEKYPSLNKDPYYRLLIDKIYSSIEQLALKQQSSGEKIRNNDTSFLLQLLGRIAISGQSRLVWSRLTLRAIRTKSSALISVLSDILRLTILGASQDDKTSSPFEIFIDHLVTPIFVNLQPCEQSGSIIKALVGTDSLFLNEHFKYIVCNKSILRANYNIDRLRQSVILHNTFSYLSSLLDKNITERHNNELLHDNQRQEIMHLDRLSATGAASSDIGDDNTGSVLIQTLVEVTNEWSNTRKTMLRVYEHNRYITCALLVAFKYATKYDLSGLTRHSVEIQSKILRALPTYLNRASGQQRNLAMCLGKLILVRLHKLIKANSVNESASRGSQKKANKAETTGQHVDDIDLGLELDWNASDDLLQLKQIFELDVGDLFPAPEDEANIDLISSEKNQNVLEKVSLSKLPGTSETGGKSTASLVNQKDQPTRKVVVLDEDDEEDPYDLKPYISSTKESADEHLDDPTNIPEEDSLGVPIYLRDCINGLIDNNDARYVRLCLVKSSEIINQMLDQETIDVEQQISCSYKQKLNDICKGGKDLSVCDSIRDVAVELAQVLIHLDDQFNIEHFDVHRIKTLTLLAVAAPDLVVKYLFEEFNGSLKSIQLQLELLQVFVASARYLSGNRAMDDNLKSNDIMARTKTSPASAANKNKRAEKINKFSKYGALFFYGLIYRLKADFNATQEFNIISQPETIVTTFKRSDSHSSEALRRPLDDGRSLIGLLKQQRQEHGGSSSDKSRQGIQSFDFVSTTDCVQMSDNSINDDNSYLLSRILFSISAVIACLDQQPITCKLATDLLDVLAAYRCHPDTGVHRAMVSCLKVIKDCTPAVYFSDNLESRTIHLFGAWLMNEMSTVNNMSELATSSPLMSSSGYSKDMP